MKKSWLLSAVTCLTLMTAACGNNAAPNNTTGGANGAATQNAGNTAGTAGAGANNTAFGLDRTDGYFGMASNNAGFFRGFGANGGTQNRGGQQAQGGNNGPSIYRDRSMGTQNANNATHLGYARVSRQQVQANALNNVMMDRDALAKVVGNVTASCPGVVNSTVVVSDEEVFVGLDTRGRDTRTTLAQARMNAMSVAPRYYKVYVTNDRDLVNELTRIASRSSNLNANVGQDDRRIENLVRRFGGQPDGEDFTRYNNVSGTGGNRQTTRTGGTSNTGMTSR